MLDYDLVEAACLRSTCQDYTPLRPLSQEERQEFAMRANGEDVIECPGCGGLARREVVTVRNQSGAFERTQVTCVRNPVRGAARCAPVVEERQLESEEPMKCEKCGGLALREAPVTVTRDGRTSTETPVRCVNPSCPEPIKYQQKLCQPPDRPIAPTFRTCSRCQCRFEVGPGNRHNTKCADCLLMPTLTAYKRRRKKGLHRPEAIECGQCGQEVEVQRFGQVPRWCSPACRMAGTRRERAEAEAPRDCDCGCGEQVTGRAQFASRRCYLRVNPEAAPPNTYTKRKEEPMKTKKRKYSPAQKRAAAEFLAQGMGVKEAAERAKVSWQALAKWVKYGHLPDVRADKTGLDDGPKLPAEEAAPKTFEPAEVARGLAVGPIHRDRLNHLINGVAPTPPAAEVATARELVERYHDPLELLEVLLGQVPTEQLQRLIAYETRRRELADDRESLRAAIGGAA